MTFRFVLSLVSVAMIIPALSRAENRFSRQERDWAEQERADRAARVKEAYRRNGPGQYSQIVFNGDGSVTFTAPRLVRGPKQLPLEYVYSDKTGVCRLFGMDNYVADTVEYGTAQGTKMAVIGNAGRYSEELGSGYPITAITCANQGTYAQTGTVDQVFDNADGSITLINPRLIRGMKQLPVEYVYSDKTGVCRLFGFEEVLPSTTTYGTAQSGAMAVIGNAGGYSEKLGSGYPIKSVTCVMRGDHRDTGFANRMERNADDSVTITNPRLIRGMQELPVEYVYSDKTGVCRLFGFEKYLADSVEYSSAQSGKMAVIGGAGRYSEDLGSGYPIRSITCYSGHYKTTATAGGYLFQDGAWLGQVRRSRSHWRSDVRPTGAPVDVQPPLRP